MINLPKIKYLPEGEMAKAVIGISCPLKKNYLFLSFISSITS